jgi:hypothetical protein
MYSCFGFRALHSLHSALHNMPTHASIHLTSPCYGKSRLTGSSSLGRIENKGFSLNFKKYWHIQVEIFCQMYLKADAWEEDNNMKLCTDDTRCFMHLKYV